MNDFEKWWKDNRDGMCATPLMQKCFEGGYDWALRRVLRVLTIAIVALGIGLLVSGCDNQFRYPCQNPANWEKAECKPPMCTVTQTCPEMLVKPEEIK
jgi:hypothetical protein